MTLFPEEMKFTKNNLNCPKSIFINCLNEIHIHENYDKDMRKIIMF